MVGAFARIAGEESDGLRIEADGESYPLRRCYSALAWRRPSPLIEGLAESGY